jgi:hypothetical protein
MAEAALHRPVDWSGFPPYVPLGMRRPPPKPPATPVRDEADGPGHQLATVASEAPLATVEAKPADAHVSSPEVVGGVSVQLDIAVERRRSHWWRLALRLVARRLR